MAISYDKGSNRHTSGWSGGNIHSFLKDSRWTCLYKRGQAWAGFPESGCGGGEGRQIAGPANSLCRHIPPGRPGDWAAGHGWSRDVGMGWGVSRGGKDEETGRRSVLEDLVGHLRPSKHAPRASSLRGTWELLRKAGSRLNPDLLNQHFNKRFRRFIWI